MAAFGSSGELLAFLGVVVVPLSALLVTLGWSLLTIYRLGEPRALIAVPVLGMMAIHQVVEGNGWLLTGVPAESLSGELVETTANLFTAGAIYYLLSLVRRERRLVGEVERSEKRYSQLVESAPSPILVLQDGEVVYTNPTADGFFAGATEQLDGESLADFVHPDDRATVRDGLEHVEESGHPLAIEPHRYDIDGRVRRATATAAPITYDSEAAVQLVFQDITEREEYQEQVETLFQSMYDALLVIDPDEDEILECNETACELLGYDRETLLEMGPSDIHPHEMDQFGSVMQRVSEQGYVLTDTLSCLRHDGVQVPASISAAPVEFRGRESLLVVVRDIRERRRRERRISVLDRVLRHNLRNDMNVVLGAAQTLADELEGETAEKATRIRQRATDLIEMSDDIRRIQSTIDPNEEVQDSTVDLVPLVSDIVEEVRQQHPETTIDLRLPEELSVRANERVRYAIEQVVENAVVHNDRPTPGVELTADVEEEWLELRVADDGPGIPEQERAVVTGVTEITSVQHGSGLGLWVAVWVVEAFDGEVTIEDNEPEGTVVTFRLKTARPELEAT